MEQAQLIEQLAIEFHKGVEGEYGCPGAACPGVKRLVTAMTEMVGVGLSPAAREARSVGSEADTASDGENKKQAFRSEIGADPEKER